MELGHRSKRSRFHVGETSLSSGCLLNGPSDPQFGVHEFGRRHGDRLDRGGIAGTSASVATLDSEATWHGSESGGNPKDSIIRLWQGQIGEAAPCPPKALPTKPGNRSLLISLLSIDPLLII